MHPCFVYNASDKQINTDRYSVEWVGAWGMGRIVNYNNCIKGIQKPPHSYSMKEDP